jgi:hypothetical protein
VSWVKLNSPGVPALSQNTCELVHGDAVGRRDRLRQQDPRATVERDPSDVAVAVRDALVDPVEHPPGGIEREIHGEGDVGHQ